MHALSGTSPDPCKAAYGMTSTHAASAGTTALPRLQWSELVPTPYLTHPAPPLRPP